MSVKILACNQLDLLNLKPQKKGEHCVRLRVLSQVILRESEGESSEPCGIPELTTNYTDTRILRASVCFCVLRKVF